jgi:hypothetical protein
MGLLEERETVARGRVEELRAEAERILAELAEAETVLERRVIARAELAEALSAPAEADGTLVSGPKDVSSVAAVKAVPVVGSQVPRRHEGMSGEALAQPGQQSAGGLAVGDIGGGHQHHHQQQAETVRDHVPFPAVDLLAAVVAARGGGHRRRPLHRLRR